MASDRRVIIDNWGPSIWAGMIILLICFAGDPDLMDGIIHWLMN